MSPSPLRLGAWSLFLFLLWSNSFVAISYLLGSERSAARFDWLSLTVARFLPAALIAFVYIIGWRRAEALALLRRHPARLLACGMLGIPLYNACLFYGQEHGVPPPIASLMTTLAPLFLLLLGRLLFQEAIGPRRAFGFFLGLAGIALISSAKGETGEHAYLGVILITACAPLSWSIYTVLSKPVSTATPVLWTYMSILVGTLPLLCIAPFRGGPELMQLDPTGWAALLFLSIGCSMTGYAIWNWLARYLPASTVGMTVFLNPPLTTLSHVLLATLFPASFAFLVLPRDWWGGGLTLLGLAVAIRPARVSIGSRRAQAG